MSDKIKIQSKLRYNVPPEKVFDTLLDPAKARNFMFATLTGKMIKAEIDPRVGGGFLFVDRRPEGDAAHYGKYLKLDRPTHLAFEFTTQKDAEESDVVTIDIAPIDQGCELTLTHEVNTEYAHIKRQIKEGWDSLLDGLGAELRAKSSS